MDLYRNGDLTEVASTVLRQTLELRGIDEKKLNELIAEEKKKFAAELSLETKRRVDLLFSEEQREEASRLLAEECGYNIPGVGTGTEDLERIRFAALKVSHGKVDRLRKGTEVAKRDYRDLLIAAGFGGVTAHKRWLPKDSETEGVS